MGLIATETGCIDGGWNFLLLSGVKSDWVEGSWDEEEESDLGDCGSGEGGVGRRSRER